MADYTYQQLHDMTVAQLREIAQGLSDASLEGYSTMHKEHLLPLLCKVLGIHIHHAATGAGKLAIKAKIRGLKAERDAAMEAHEAGKLTKIRHQMHSLKRRLRRMAASA